MSDGKKWTIKVEGHISSELKEKIKSTGMQVLQEYDEMLVGFGTDEQAEEVRKTTPAKVHEDQHMSIL